MRERKVWSDGEWDTRTERTVVSCIGGPADGGTMPVPPGVRTVRDRSWGSYYEIMRHGVGVALVWQAGAFCLDVARKQAKEGASDA